MRIILDLETQELIPENRDLSTLRVSLAGVIINGHIRTFTEDTLSELFMLLDAAELIAGHNLLNFDYLVLQRYADFNVKQRYSAKTFDLLRCIMNKTDRMVGLNDVAKRTLGLQKSGSGADAPLLFREQRWQELTEYLAQDLAITAALIDHIAIHGCIKYGHIAYKEPIERELRITLAER